MINIITTLVFFVLTNLAFGQTKDSFKCIQTFDSLTKKNVYMSVDKMPEVKGGETTLIKLIYKEIKYPDGDYVGSVYVAFIVNPDGTLDGKRILRDPSKNKFGNQILNLIDHLEWIAGSCSGNVVPVLYKLPINIDVK